MSSFVQRSCFSCGNPVDDQPCRYCTCERCGYYNREKPPICYDDDDDYDYEKSTIPLNEIDSRIPLSNAITLVLPTLEPEDSLILGNEELSTILEKESDEFIKSSVEGFVLIPSESEDTFGSDSECILPSCDDFSPINVYEETSMNFSNPLFNSNDDFSSSDDESLFDEDILKDNVKIYSNPLFKFDDEYISSNVNPLFDEVLENIECKVSYDSNLDEPTLLVTPLSDSNEDECLALSDDIELLLHHDPSISVVSILEGFTDEPPLEENDDLFDLESKMNDWKKILYDAPIDDLIFDPGGDIDEIDTFLNVDISTDIEDGYHDLEGDILYLKCLLSNDTILSLPPKVFLNHDPRSLSDINGLKIMVKVFDPGIHEKNSSPTHVRIFNKKDKNEAKQSKPSTGMERVQEIEAEGVYILNGPSRTYFIWPVVSAAEIQLMINLVDIVLASGVDITIERYLV
ncbi:hypothetical protein Tco_0478512 [Tanacetum coccineum]